MNVAVVDASVAVKWVVAEELADKALLLRGVRQLLAPAHWLSEATNALWAKAMRQELSNAEAEHRVALLMRAPVTPVPLPDLLATATRLALDLRHPVYDCLYLALALERSVPLITADRRLRSVAANHAATLEVIWLADLGR